MDERDRPVLEERLTTRVTAVTLTRVLLPNYIKKVEMADDGVGVEVETKPVGFWEAFWFWVKLGFINFGGPAGQIAIMHRELVEKKRWVSESQYLEHSTSACCCRGQRRSRSPLT